MSTNIKVVLLHLSLGLPKGLLLQRTYVLPRLHTWAARSDLGFSILLHNPYLIAALSRALKTRKISPGALRHVIRPGGPGRFEFRTLG